MSEIIKCEELVSVNELKKILIILAALDVIMLPKEDAWLRLHRWTEYKDERLSVAEINNGSGDTLFIIFSPAGCIIKGFDHESFFSPYARDEFAIWPGVYDEVPVDLLALLNDVSFEKDHVTFCIWNDGSDLSWRKGTLVNPDKYDDGTDFLLGYINTTAENYCEWAQDYYEETLPLEAIKQIYKTNTITKHLMSLINNERDIDEAINELRPLGILNEVI